MPKPYKSIRPMFVRGVWRIFRNDTVVVRSGPDKGMTGKVLEVLRDQRVPQVIVEGLNMRKRRIRQGYDEDDFFVVSMEAPIHYSRVAVADPVTKQPVPTRFRYLADGTRVRLGKGQNASGTIIPIPLEADPNIREGLVGEKDTAKVIALRGTYDPSAGFPFKLAQLEAQFGALGSSRRTFSSSAGRPADQIPHTLSFSARSFSSCASSAWPPHCRSGVVIHATPSSSDRHSKSPAPVTLGAFPTFASAGTICSRGILSSRSSMLSEVADCSISRAAMRGYICPNNAVQTANILEQHHQCILPVVVGSTRCCGSSSAGWGEGFGVLSV